MATCTACGHTTPEGKKNCLYCGKPITSPSQLPPSGSVSPPATGSAFPPAPNIPCPNCRKPTSTRHARCAHCHATIAHPNDEQLKAFFANLRCPQHRVSNQAELLSQRLVQDGFALIDERKFNEAIQKSHHAERLTPRYSWAWVLNGIAQFYLGEFIEGERCFDRAIEFDPYLTVVQDVRTQLVRWRNEALDQLRATEPPPLSSAPRQNTASRRAYFWLCRSAELNKMRRFAEAQQCVFHALQLSPQCEDAVIPNVALLANRGFVSQAIALAQKTMPESKKTLDLALLLDQLEPWLDNPKEISSHPIVFSVPNPIDKGAISIYESALHLGEAPPYTQSLSLLEQALAIDAEYPDALATKGHHLFILNRIDEAFQAVEKAIELDPFHFKASGYRADILLHKRDLERALRAYDHLLDINPENTDFEHNRHLCVLLRQGYSMPNIQQAMDLAVQGVAHKHSNNIPAAIQLFEQAIAIAPHPGILYNLANACYSVKAVEQALIYWQRTVEIDPKHYRAWMNRGVALEAVGHLRQAYECYQRVLAIDPLHQNAYSRVKALHPLLE